ncbi:MAG: M23 family metallopeptidase, partial [Thermoanaerobacterium sp.]|nr:M23 family metallopeptidase [Thermoanaerobacterium sp.]
MDNEDKSNPFSCNLIKKVSIKRRFIITATLTILFAVVFYIGIDKSAFSNMEDYSLNHFAYSVGQGRFDAYLKSLSDKNLRIDRPTAIMVDGLNVVTLKNRKDASCVLNAILDKYKNGSMKAYFKNDVKLVEVDNPIVKIETIEEAVNKLEDEDDTETYMVKDNDTLWSIARKFNVTLDDIYKLNPTIGNIIFKGQILKVKEPKPVLTVVSEKKVVYMDDIPHETVYQKDSDMFANTSKVIVHGEDGVKIVTAVLKYYNGQISEEDVVNEDVVKEPVSEIVSVGVKPLSATFATGVFDFPIRGHIVITSRYGQRWGRLHAGIDIAASINDPIYAADGGTVVFAGWENGYGNLVKIDHGNGYVTYYGHASKLLVKRGDKVYKGQEIALVGMTGNT